MGKLEIRAYRQCIVGYIRRERLTLETATSNDEAVDRRRSDGVSSCQNQRSTNGRSRQHADCVRSGHRTGSAECEAVVNALFIAKRAQHRPAGTSRSLFQANFIRCESSSSFFLLFVSICHTRSADHTRRSEYRRASRRPAAAV